MWRKNTNDTKCDQTGKDTRIFSEEQGSTKPKVTKLAFEGGISKRRTILHSRMVSHPRIQQSTSSIKGGKRKPENPSSGAQTSTAKAGHTAALSA